MTVQPNTVAEGIRPAYEARLAARGVLAAMRVARITGDDKAWTYPVFTPEGQPAMTSDGRPVLRHKMYDSAASPKYWWSPPNLNGARPAYYMLPGATKAMSVRSCAYIASGEPDVWTLYAAGIPNALCWFGEGSVPATLAKDLEGWGAIVAFAFPDRDATGDRWMHKVRAALRGSGVTLIARSLPAMLGDGGDLNSLWLSVGKDALAFSKVLDDAPEYVFEKPSDPLPLPAPPALNGVGGERDLPAEFYEAIVRALSARGAVWKDGEDWSSFVACPMRYHEHDDRSPRFHFNKSKMAGYCHKCGQVFLSIAVGDALGIDWKSYATKRVAVPPAQPEHGAPVATGVSPSGVQAPPAPQPPPVAPGMAAPSAPGVLWDDALKQYEGWFADQPVVHGAPAPLYMPFVSLARMGGFAEFMFAGKSTLIIGGSGRGKTSLIESMTDGFRLQGADGIYWGPEWTPLEYVMRGVQRYGGPSLIESVLHAVYLEEESRAGTGQGYVAALDPRFTKFRKGLPPGGRVGRKMSAESLAKVGEAIAFLKSMAGRVYFVEGMAPRPEYVIDKIVAIIRAAAHAGRRIRWVVIDYVQMFGAGRENEVAVINGAITAIKSLVVNEGLHGIVASQPTKAAQAAAKEGRLLDQESMLAGRDSPFNLTLSINPVYEGNGYRMFSLDLGEGPRKYALAQVNVAKNSVGKNGRCELAFDPRAMRWPFAAPSPEGAPPLTGAAK